MIKHCHGQYTIDQIQRCGQMSGPFKKEMSRLMMYGAQTDEHDHHDSRRKTPKYYQDLGILLDELKEDKLFAYHHGRAHKGFKDFEVRPLTNGYAMGLKLKELSKKIDMWKRIRQCENKQHL